MNYEILRMASQGTAGVTSLAFTFPFVAFSISGAYSAGTLPRCRQLFTT